MNFKAGDRVNVYGGGPDDGCWSGMVVGFRSQPWGTGITVESSFNSIIYTIHPKQCRLLKKKERRRIWIYESCFNEIQDVNHISDDKSFQCLRDNPMVFTKPSKTTDIKDPLIEFVEVKKK